MIFLLIFKDHNSGRKHENYKNNPIWFIYFFCSTCLQYLFLSLKILKIHFQIHYPGSFWSINNLNFLPKATDLDVSSYFSRIRHPEVTKNLYYVLSPHQSQIPIFMLQLMDSIGGWRIQSLSAFSLISQWKKMTSYSSKSRKIYTLRLLCCWCSRSAGGRVFLFSCERLGRDL